MPVFDRFQLEKLSQQTGFVRDNLEKVYRLTEILSFFNQDERLGQKLALKGGLAREFDHDLLRKMVLFYLTVGGSDLPQVKYDPSFCDTIKYPQIRATLVPMLRKSEKFDFEEAKRVVSLFLTELLDFSEQEKRFVEEFNAGHYTPCLLFDDSNIIERVENHPMALWKMQHWANNDTTNIDI